MRDHFWSVRYLDALKEWWNKCLSVTYNVFSPPPLTQYVCEWLLWAYQKINLVLPHAVSAAGSDRAIHVIWQCPQMHAEETFQLGSAAVCSAPSCPWQKATRVVCLPTCYCLTSPCNQELDSRWKDTMNMADPLKRRKHVVGIFGDCFLVTAHLWGLDAGHHLLGHEEHSSKPTKTTALQVMGGEWLWPSKPCWQEKSWGTYPAWNDKAPNQQVSINSPGFHTHGCLYSVGKQLLIKANWSNVLCFLCKQ